MAAEEGEGVVLVGAGRTYAAREAGRLRSQAPANLIERGRPSRSASATTTNDGEKSRSRCSLTAVLALTMLSCLNNSISRASLSGFVSCDKSTTPPDCFCCPSVFALLMSADTAAMPRSFASCRPCQGHDSVAVIMCTCKQARTNVVASSCSDTT